MYGRKTSVESLFYTPECSVFNGSISVPWKKRASEVQFVKACTYSAECSQNKDAEYNSIFTACLQQSSDLHDGHNTPLYINEAS